MDRPRSIREPPLATRDVVTARARAHVVQPRVGVLLQAAEPGDSPAEEPAVAVARPAPKDSLSAYGRIIEAYYLERRCTFLSRRKMKSFYKAVVKNHRAVISEFGKPAVSKVMKSAEARSNYQSCNGAGEARVKAGFGEIASRWQWLTM
jgi:hypothetical protein